MDWKKFVKKLFFPSIWIVVLLTIFSGAGLAFVFVKGFDTSLAAIFVYVVSFYALTILSIAVCTKFPRYYKNTKQKVYKNKYANQYLTDVEFKTHVTLYISLFINLVYVGVNAVSAYVYETNWFGIFAVYYAIMAIMRFLLVRYVGKNHLGESRLGEWRRARFCAYILLSVNLTLSGVVLMMVYFERGFEYQGFLIYVMALYTFCCTAAAIVDLMKYRRYHSPVMSISKIIKLASALFSMLFLETAMFSQFGMNTAEETKRIMIMATGAGISVIVVTMAVYMIVRSTKELKKIRGKV